MNQKELQIFLDEQSEKYNNPKFIGTDPIQIPHQFSKKEDIEIIGFLASIIAWGNRTMIIKNCEKLISIMQPSPYTFIKNYEEQELEFVHRTFNSVDLNFFFISLKNIYLNHYGLEAVFNKGYEKNNSIKESIIYFREVFFSLEHEKRTEKHIANPAKKSAAKRINMFLRWMVRNDHNGVDFGIWKKIDKKDLFCPLDVHTSRVARKLGLITRKQDDWMALEELNKNLLKFDSKDPVKYDFALFGISAFEKIDFN
jgi:uncharacterized protein (TIGR02757 family)